MREGEDMVTEGVRKRDTEGRSDEAVKGMGRKRGKREGNMGGKDRGKCNEGQRELRRKGLKERAKDATIEERKVYKKEDVMRF